MKKKKFDIDINIFKFLHEMNKNRYNNSIYHEYVHRENYISRQLIIRNEKFRRCMIFKIEMSNANNISKIS